MKYFIFLSILLINCLSAIAQDSISFPGKIGINGYLKDLQTLSFNNTFNELISSNLIHNRINLKWQAETKITVVAEIRNRMFWGEEIRFSPGFSSSLRNENEMFNFQKVWINNNSLVLHSNIERLFIDFRNDKLNIRLGRQRINWGITTTWNPNDLFNTYNFLDFDYEERPGSDGGKIQYIFDNSLNVEIGYSAVGENKKNIAAIKFLLNKWNYDIQLIAGLYKNNPTVGAGWAGSIKDAGFKGEIQYFFKSINNEDHLNLSIEGDYMFNKGWYLNSGLLFNSNGLIKPLSNWENFDLKISPENLMPTKWNLIISISKEINPLLSATTSFIYAPGTNILILFPSLQYSFAPNLDVGLIWQSFFAQNIGGFKAINHRGFLRVKWSY